MLKIAIVLLGILLAVLLIVAVALSGYGAKDQGIGTGTTGDHTGNSSTQTSTDQGELNSGTQETETTPQQSTAPAAPTDMLPTADSPLHLGKDLYVVQIGNFSGRYVEDGSDMDVTDVCAVAVVNRGQQTVQLAQFQISHGTNVYEFRLTTLPPGETAIVQELNRMSFENANVRPVAAMETAVLFNQEPTLHEDVFGITGSEGGIELRNLTNEDIAGPIYVYYKTRTADGFAGGITYRITVPELKAGDSYQAAAAHFWAGSSQVMFVEYAQ